MLLEANSKLEELHSKTGLTTETLLSEFDAQVVAQTRPLARQSKNNADKKIRLVMALTEEQREYKRERDDLQNKLSGSTADDQAEIQLQLQELKPLLKKLKDRIKNHRRALGVDGRNRLEKFLGNEFLALRMNALALKQRLRSRLCSRKMEISQIEKALRKASSNHKKLATHADQEIKRKEPAIQQLAKKYNEMCEKLSAMIDRGEAPRKALKPVQVPLRGLFRLDVEDDIWQDVGLLGSELGDEESQSPPLWLSSDDVRKGIKHCLDRICCEKEIARLRLEKRAMMQWAREEWEVILRALVAEGNPSVIYLLQCEQQRLREVIREWESSTREIPHPDGESWVDRGRIVSLREEGVGVERATSPTDSVGSDAEDNLSDRVEEAECLDFMEETYAIGDN